MVVKAVPRQCGEGNKEDGAHTAHCSQFGRTPTQLYAFSAAYEGIGVLTTFRIAMYASYMRVCYVMVDSHLLGELRRGRLDVGMDVEAFPATA